MKFPKLLPHRNPKYKAFIQQQKCYICRALPPSHHHHIFAEGVGTKCSDYESMPLCNDHHREFHDKGREEFAEHYGCIDYFRVITKYLEEYIEKFIV
jgi:hypothetical protein